MRRYHPWDRWECFRAGFYGTDLPLGVDCGRSAYAEFLSDTDGFTDAMGMVAREWPVSAEHFLGNRFINRVAWLGQSAMCITTGVPSSYRGGFYLLSERQQEAANLAAAEFLAAWTRAQRWCGESLTTPDPTPATTTQGRVRQYIESWLVRGYADGIPDEVPVPLMRLGLAPSHRAIAEALLRNDMALLSLGFSPPTSEWYGTLKRIEISARPVKPSAQMELVW